MDKLKELTLREASRRRQELQKQIKEDELKLASMQDEVKLEKERVAHELVSIRKEADSIKATIMEKAKPVVAENKLDRSDDKTYRFVLNSCYNKDRHFYELFCETDTLPKSYFIMPKNSKLGMDVDVSEMAEDFDTRANWTNKWSTSKIGPMEMTFKQDAKFKRIIEYGILEYGAIRDTGQKGSIYELFLHGNNLFGKMNIEMLDTCGTSEWYATFDGYVGDQRPYILTHEAMESNYFVEFNLSCLPRKVKKRVPKDMAFWEVTEDKDRILMRNSLVKGIDDGKYFFPLGQESNGKFTVIKEWVPREKEIYHLLIQSKGMLKLCSDTDMTSFTKGNTAFNLADSQLAVKPELSKLTTITLSEESPRFAKAVDWGTCIVYENTAGRKTVKFLGAKMRDIMQFNKVGDGWQCSILESNRTSGQDLTNEQIDTIIEMSKAKKEKREISETAHCGEKTVYLYQKVLGFV